MARKAKSRDGGVAARRAFYGGLSTEHLVGLMRRDDYHALREFVARYRPLLVNFAGRAGIAVADVETVAADVLSDVAMELMTGRAAAPRSMESYVVTCFKHRVLNLERERGRRVVREGVASDGVEEATGERVSRSACSEATLRAAAGPLWEPVPLNPRLERLSSMLDEGLSSEERHLLAWVSERVPQSAVGKWLGLSHDTTRKKLERLRKRLDDVAERYAESLTGKEQRELLRFFRRFDAVIGSDPRPSPGTMRASNE